jgi:hypothetical protein
MARRRRRFFPGVSNCSIKSDVHGDAHHQLVGFFVNTYKALPIPLGVYAGVAIDHYFGLAFQSEIERQGQLCPEIERCVGY